MGRRSSEHDLRHAWIATTLTGASGTVDAVGYIALFHVFTANMSGNSISLGIAWSTHDGFLAAQRGAVLGAFFAGLLASRFIVHAFWRRRRSRAPALIFSIEIVLLALLAVLGNGPHQAGRLAHASVALRLLLAVLPALAMGLQNATLSRFGPLTIRTTHVTGTLASLADELAELTFWARDRTRGRSRRRLRSVVAAARRHRHTREAVLLLGTWTTYVAGAIAGAWMERGIGLWAMLLPMGLLLVVVIADVAQPLEREEKDAAG